MVIIKWEEKCGKFSGLVVVPVVSVLQIYIFRYNGYWVWDNEENLVVVIVILVLEISVFWFEVISIFWVIVCFFFLAFLWIPKWVSTESASKRWKAGLSARLAIDENGEVEIVGSSSPQALLGPSLRLPMQP